MRTERSRRSGIRWGVGLALLLSWGMSGAARAAGGGLVVTPDVARQGQMLSAMWFGTSAPTSQVRLQLFDANGHGRGWYFNYEGAEQGDEAFVLPGDLKPGRYELRLLSRADGRLQAISNPFTVEAGIPALTASSVVRPPGEVISATWVGLASASPGDWIGLFPAGDDDAPEIAWQETDDAVFGTVPLTLPANLQPGYYELRLFGNGGRSLQAISNYFRVVPGAPALTVGPVLVRAGGSLEAVWHGTSAPTSQVRLQLYGADRQARGWYFNHEGATSGDVRFPLPGNLKPGVYELWLTGRADGRLLAISNRFTVDPRAPR